MVNGEWWSGDLYGLQLVGVFLFQIRSSFFRSRLIFVRSSFFLVIVTNSAIVYLLDYFPQILKLDLF